MGIFSKLETRNVPKSLPPAVRNAMGDMDNIRASESDVLGISGVWCAIVKQARTIANMPLNVYEKVGNGREKASNHPLYKMLHSKPNDNLTAWEWKFVMVSNLLLHGAGISQIVFNSKGYPQSLSPLPTKSVKPAKTQSGELVYEYTNDNGQVKRLRPQELLIFSFYPTVGGGWLSPLDVHRGTFSGNLAVRQYQQKAFSQGINPAGIVSGVEFGDEQSQKTLKDRFEAYSGLGNAHKLMLLQTGEKFEKISIDPEKNQMTETQKLSNLDIARVFALPSILVCDTATTAWGSGIETLLEAYRTLTIQPIITLIEEVINSKLLSDNDSHYCKFNMDSLQRGTIESRYKAYEIAARLGMYSIDDLLGFEDKNPIEFGDTRLVPHNMQTLENAIFNTKIFMEEEEKEDE